MVIRKAKITVFISLLFIGLMGVGHIQAESHSKAYKERVEQLLELDGIYQNKDGSIGGVFKLTNGETARIAGIDEKGNLYVSYKKEVVKYSTKELELFLSRKKQVRKIT